MKATFETQCPWTFKDNIQYSFLKIFLLLKAVHVSPPPPMISPRLSPPPRISKQI